MAIKLKESNAVFFEIFKTGTTFIRHSLDVCNIGYYDYQPFSYIKNEKRHCPWWAYKYVKHKICTIRHPISWYESFWRYFNFDDRRGLQLSFFRDVENLLDKDFNIFISRIILEKPCYYTRMVEQFLGPDYSLMTRIIKNENLNNDLFSILLDLGYEKETILPILTLERQNVSDHNIEIKWDEENKRKILYLEQEIINRFYNV